MLVPRLAPIALVAEQAASNTIGSKDEFEIDNAVGAAGGKHQPCSPTDLDVLHRVLRASTDLALRKKVTWRVIFARLRNAFDPSIAFSTPQVGMQISVKVTDSSTIYAKVFRWNNGAPDVTGIGAGYRDIWK